MEPKHRKTYVNSISQNVRGLIVSGRRISGLHYLQMSKQNEQKMREKCIQSDQPAWNPVGASATPQSRKFPVFDCAVALCTMQNALLVISNLTCLIVLGRRMSGLHVLQMSKQNEQKMREKIHTVRPAGLKPRRSFSYTITTKNSWFDCAVALCTTQNALLVISNLTWLEFLCGHPRGRGFPTRKGKGVLVLG
jgi:hypothetical protein